ncbi:hypothetical protein ACRAWG_12135 [Methylobacterium sp. P31]
MRTALIALIVLVRFGPDIVYAAGASLPRPAPRVKRRRRRGSESRPRSR